MKYNEVSSNQEITTQKLKRTFFSPHQDLNHDFLEPKYSMLPMSYADPYVLYLGKNYLVWCIKIKTTLSYKRFGLSLKTYTQLI